jgi:uncharacterized surface protein with fasciclin (FAS1) repeats|tara:strand:- start:730 stop:1299 length:570 start_codon:yes stop_codon:yes gene_type:complete
MITKMLKTTTAALILSVGASAASAQSMGNPMVGGAEMFANRTIVENAVNSADHTTLVAAVQAAGLVDTLSGPGPFTVFAPTNDAFDELPDGLVNALLQEENLSQLQLVLTCHVVAADAMSDAIAGMISNAGGAYPIRTVGGCTMTGRMENGNIVIEDPRGRVATVTIADVDQSNGVIHVIDRVLLPAEG